MPDIQKARIGDMKNTYESLAEKCERKRQFGIPWSTWEDNINMNP
jgi:hypothetical protein